MSDEMEAYRGRIERRYADRRLKNGRRRYERPPVMSPKAIDAGTIVCIAILIGFALLMSLGK